MSKDYDEFFKKPREQSIIKKEIVTKYFPIWAGIMSRTVKKHSRNKDYRLGYIDLYCGPGMYYNGVESTPITIMKHILSNTDYQENFITIFNDCNDGAIESLQENFELLDNYDKLKHKPVFYCSEIDTETIKYFDIDIIPSFIFLDPFGFKGITIELISKLVRSFGCDIILFFNYNSIQRHLTNEKVSSHMKNLFTPEMYDELVNYLKLNPRANREDSIITHFKKALKSNNANYVLPFRFVKEDENRTSHYLFFITKHELGAQKIKDIMWLASSKKVDNIASFEFIPNCKDTNQFTIFDMCSLSLNDLKQALYKDLSEILDNNQKIPILEIYSMYTESIYTNDNIKQALLELEKENRIIVNGRIKKSTITLPKQCTISIK